MAKVLILVEGPSEESFVTGILSPHLGIYRVYPVPVIIKTRRNVTGPDDKGGMVKYAEAKKQILRLLSDSSARMVTTMFDYYGLDKSFPGREQPNGRTCYDKASGVEQAIAKDINSYSRFLPYLQLHEYEGLLFCSPEIMANELAEPGSEENLNLRKEFSQIQSNLDSPEEINDSKLTSPSHRIIHLFPHYGKVEHGVNIINRIGLDPIRSQCPHFRQWLERLESLS